jgi:hypothetical protein
MTKPAHDNLQSAMWRDQIKADLRGYIGPRKEELQRKE